jgi:long-chain acyl-CoA synthetase
MIEIPRTINELFMNAVRQFNGPRAICHKRADRWVEVSHLEAMRRARAVALGLHTMGVRRAEPVLLLAENCLEWILADLGTLLCGAIDVPLYHNSSTAQVEYIAQESAARVAFVSDSNQLQKLNAVRVRLPRLERIVLLTEVPSSADYGELMTLSELERRGDEVLGRDPGLFDSLWQPLAASDPATIIYTSGTTGRPKGVILSHGNITSNVTATHNALHLGNESNIALSYLPFAHIFERNNIYGYLYEGIPFYLAESINTVASNLIEVRPTIMSNVPRMFEKIYRNIVLTAARGSSVRSAVIRWCISIGLRHAERAHKGYAMPIGLRAAYAMAYLIMFHRLRKSMGGRLRYPVSGGAPLAPEIAYLFLAARMPILQGYGLTETSPVISVNTSDANRIGTVGKPIPGVDVHIVDDGEILVRGPGVMSGYFHREAETQAAFADGWFKTGDIGRLDADGYLIVTDRKKDLIKTSGGKYVAPFHVESLILSSRFISQAVVVGNGRRFPSALIVPNSEMIRSYAELKGISAPDYAGLIRNPQVVNLIERQVARYTEELPQFEKIKRIALIEHEFSAEGGELTLTQKLRRQVVENKYRSVIDSMYEEEGMPIHDSGIR